MSKDSPGNGNALSVMHRYSGQIHAFRFFPVFASFLLALLTALIWCDTASAQNATQNTNNQVVTVASQSVGNLIAGRISFVTAPVPTTTTTTSTGAGSSNPAPGGSVAGNVGSQSSNSGGGGSNTGGSGGGSGAGTGGQGAGGAIPVPGKDHSSLDQPFGGGLLLPGGGKTMFATASDGQATGLSAGDPEEAARLGLWAMGSMSWISNTKTGTKYNGNIVTMLGGVDYKFTPKFMAGLASGYQGTFLNTAYDNGWNNSTGVVAMSYASYSFLDNLVADASFGVTPTRYEISSASASQGVTRTGYGSLRVLQTTNLTYYIIPSDSNWNFSLKAGNMLSNEHDYATGSKDSFLGEMSGGAKAAYTWKWLTASAGGMYMFDYSTQTPNDRNEIQALLGTKIQMRDSLSLSLDGYNSFLRANGKFHNTGLSATFRAEF